MLGYLAAGAGLLMAGRLFWMIDDWSRDWSSNHARWENEHVDESMRPIVTEADLSQTETVIRDWVRTQSRWSIVPNPDDTVPKKTPPTDSQVPDESSPAGANDSARLHLIHRTPVFRFVDDVHVQLEQIVDASGIPRTRIDAESQSRIGKGDLGQNPRNLKTLHRGMTSGLKELP